MEPTLLCMVQSLNFQIQVRKLENSDIFCKYILFLEYIRKFQICLNLFWVKLFSYIETEGSETQTTM